MLSPAIHLLLDIFPVVDGSGDKYPTIPDCTEPRLVATLVNANRHRLCMTFALPRESYRKRLAPYHHCPTVAKQLSAFRLGCRHEWFAI